MIDYVLNQTEPIKEFSLLLIPLLVVELMNVNPTDVMEDKLVLRLI